MNMQLTMNRLTQTSAEAACTGLPSDLSTWLDKTSLVTLALEAVQEAPKPNAAGRFEPSGGLPCRPEMLMTLLAYCYATGLTDSAEIERQTAIDPVLRYIAAGERPAAADVIRLRRSNRARLEDALASLLRRAWQIRQGALSIPGGRLVFASLPPDFNRLARARVAESILLDSVDRDL